MTADQPILVIIRGLPGSGKSYLATRLAAALGPDNVVSLDPDTVDRTSEEYLAHSRALTEEGVDLKTHLFRFSRSKAMEAIREGKTVIWNQPFSNRVMFDRMIDFLRDYAGEHGMNLYVLLVEIGIDPKLAYERVVGRKRAGGHGPSEATFGRFQHDYVSYADNGSYAAIEVKAPSNPKNNVQMIVDGIAQLKRTASSSKS